MENAWQFLGSSGENQSFMIGGVNVWSQTWESPTGEKVTVKDPHHGESYIFSVYEIRVDGKRVQFLAGEFSNGIYGFYVPIDQTKLTSFRKHLFLALLPSLLMFLLYFTPVSVCSCLNKGIIAATIALGAALSGIFFALKAIVEQRRENLIISRNFALIAAILALPALLLLGPLG
ncbi:hypothetical protein JNK13_00170 [bacterium]|nr:hypothetical protein [bacterium]